MNSLTCIEYILDLDPLIGILTLEYLIKLAYDTIATAGFYPPLNVTRRKSGAAGFEILFTDPSRSSKDVIVRVSADQVAEGKYKIVLDQQQHHQTGDILFSSLKETLPGIGDTSK